MNNVVHLHERQMRTDYVGYASGITGFQHPGPFSIAYALMAPEGRELARELINTNMSGSGHESEYLAMMYLSRAVATRFAHVRHLWLFSSNKLVVNQLCGCWRIYNDRFQTFVDKIHSNLKDIQWGITWMPRIQNQLKDWHWERYEESHPGESRPDSAMWIVRSGLNSVRARGKN